MSARETRRIRHESAGRQTRKPIDLQLRTRIAEDFPEDESERRERERKQDSRERDEFSERFRRRDKDKTEKAIEDHSPKASGATAEAALRRQLADDTVARTLAMPSLCEHSCQEYLTKRELQQVELLRNEIADDEARLRGMRTSKREQRELDHKKEVLKLVEERLSIDDKWDELYNLRTT